MAQRRIRPSLLKENIYGTNFPSPTVREFDFPRLNGGLNTWELDYKLEANQSSDCLNVYYKDGCLSSRPGQKYIFNQMDESSPEYGDFVSCYPNEWHGYIVAHKGNHLYKINPETGVHTQLFTLNSTDKGAGFFVFQNKLYYLGGGNYVVIDNTVNATEVEAYIPTVAINRKPNGTGGDLYQPENRISSGRRIQFTSDGESVEYVLNTGSLVDSGAVKKLEAKVLKLNSDSILDWISYTFAWYYATYADFPAEPVLGDYYYAALEDKYYIANPSYVEITDPDTLDNLFTCKLLDGKVYFAVAPPQTDVETVNNVEITYYKADEAAMQSILSCRCVTVYGGDGINLAVIVGGSTAQPNAYFWSGNDSLGLNPGYFPYEYYNLAGNDANQFICDFGKQQSMLIIFSEKCVGKSTFSVNQISGRDYLQLPYVNINDMIGCDLTGSVQLIQNNLVFANTYSGVYVLADTSSANENNILRLSRNINGTARRPGLLYDLTRDTTYREDYLTREVVSLDDNQRYWLLVGEHVYLWDYTIKSYRAAEQNLSWFYFDNIRAKGYVKIFEDIYYFDEAGSLIKFISGLTDFDAPIVRKYTFATLNFGTYEKIKDVLKVIFSLRSNTGSTMTITYKTDYEEREDLEPIKTYRYSWVPRNLQTRNFESQVNYAGVAIRKPGCFHIRHFTMTLENAESNADMYVVSAQVFYRFSREDM